MLVVQYHIPGQQAAVFIQQEFPQIRGIPGIGSMVLADQHQGHQRPLALPLFQRYRLPDSVFLCLLPFLIIILHRQIQIIGNGMLVIGVGSGKRIFLFPAELFIPFVEGLERAGYRIQGGDHPFQLQPAAHLPGKGSVSHSRSPEGDHRQMGWIHSPLHQFAAQQGGTGTAQAVTGEQQFFLGMGLIKGRQVLRFSVPVHIHRLGKDRPGVPEESLVDCRSLGLFGIQQGLSPGKGDLPGLQVQLPVFFGGTAPQGQHRPVFPIEGPVTAGQGKMDFRIPVLYRIGCQLPAIIGQIPAFQTAVRTVAAGTDRGGHPNSVVGLTIHEGRKHQVKKMLMACGHKVLRLHRDAFGPLRLSRLKEGSWRLLDPTEVAAVESLCRKREKGA